MKYFVLFSLTLFFGTVLKAQTNPTPWDLKDGNYSFTPVFRNATP